ncbi:MAG: ImmA/IrrE family metallo-endopeptidase [Pirellulales bacterium]
MINKARALGYKLPSPATRAMGSVVWRAPEGDRAVTLKQRLIPVGASGDEGVVWGVWDVGEEVGPRIVRYESAVPDEKRVAHFLKVLKLWIIDRGTGYQLDALVEEPHLPEQVDFDVDHATNGQQRIQVGPHHEFDIEIGKSSWSIVSGGRPLSSRHANTRSLTLGFPLDGLEHLADWIRSNWEPIAFGTDVRPLSILETNPSACKAYAIGLDRTRHDNDGREALERWWSRHAVRAADARLPNLFFERQEDEILISWDSTESTDARFSIGAGVVSIAAEYAVPGLRNLMMLHCSNRGNGRDRYPFGPRGYNSQAGLRILRSYRAADDISRNWLDSVGFQESDSAQFATVGTSRHPVVGLLRSSRNSGLELCDIQGIIEHLSSAQSNSYAGLRLLAGGLDATIDPKEPWESGYVLARQIREKLHLLSGMEVDVDRLVNDSGVDVVDLPLADSEVRGACVGAPQYKPLIVVNTNCPHAHGQSGRRITLAHEFCHLLFDRSRMRGLARFEGRFADGDRLFEMRANAFAVELLLPMVELLDEQGNVVSDDRLREISVERKISMHALSPHVDNLRRRIRSSY